MSDADILGPGEHYEGIHSALVSAVQGDLVELGFSLEVPILVLVS